MTPNDLPTHLIGGVTRAELMEHADSDLALHSLTASTTSDSDHLASASEPSVHARLVVLVVRGCLAQSDVFYSSRQLETVNIGVIYRFHPMFKDADFQFWYPDSAHCDEHDEFEIQDFGRSALEGGDVMPIGNGTILVGISERTTPQMVKSSRSACSRRMLRRESSAWTSRSSAPTCTSTLRSRSWIATLSPSIPKVIETTKAFSVRPGNKPGSRDVTPEKTFLGAVANALGLKKESNLRVVTTGGDEAQQEREQWDSGNNLVAIEPGVVVAYSKNIYSNQKYRDAGIEVVEIDGFEVGKGCGGDTA